MSAHNDASRAEPALAVDPSRSTPAVASAVPVTAPQETPGRPEGTTEARCLNCGKVKRAHVVVSAPTRVIYYCYRFARGIAPEMVSMEWREPTSLEAELSRLRSEVHRLDGEREVLAGAVAWAESQAVTVYCNYASGDNRFTAAEHGLDGCGPDTTAHGATWLAAITALREKLSAARPTPQDTTDANTALSADRVSP